MNQLDLDSFRSEWSKEIIVKKAVFDKKKEETKKAYEELESYNRITFHLFQVFFVNELFDEIISKDLIYCHIGTWPIIMLKRTCKFFYNHSRIAVLEHRAMSRITKYIYKTEKEKEAQMIRRQQIYMEQLRKMDNLEDDDNNKNNPMSFTVCIILFLFILLSYLSSFFVAMVLPKVNH